MYKKCCPTVDKLKKRYLNYIIVLHSRNMYESIRDNLHASTQWQSLKKNL